MKSNNYKFVVSKDCILRDFLKENMSKKMYKNLRNNAEIFCNGTLALRHINVKCNDIIEVVIKGEDKADDWPLYEVLPEIIYETSDYMVVNKPKSLLTIPTKSEPQSLYQSIIYYYKVNNIFASVSFVNRLDKETQGLVLVAKNRLAAYYFNNDKENINRKYLAMLNGILAEKEGTITTYIDKDEHKRFVSDKGKLAISNYKVLKEINGESLVLFSLKTGRTHQIRVHSQYLDAPIIGDPIYGTKTNEIMMLCSYYLEFTCPITNKLLHFEIEPKWVDYYERKSKK